MHKGFKIICQHCAKNFTQDSDLNKHIESVHGIKTVGARSKYGSTMCKKCGFKARQFHWHCPACNSWESLPSEPIDIIMDNKI